MNFLEQFDRDGQFVEPLQVGADDSQEPTSDIPLGVPTAARMYDEALGGKDNFEVDRAANAKLYEAVGEHRIRSTALENRRFLGRAVRYLAQECGVRQFLDLGSFRCSTS